MQNKYDLYARILVKDDINTDDKVFVIKRMSDFLATGVFTEYNDFVTIHFLEITDKLDNLDFYLLNEVTTYLSKTYDKVIRLGVRPQEHKLLIAALQLGYRLYSVSQINIDKDTLISLKYDAKNSNNDYNLPNYIVEEIQVVISNIQKMFKDE